MKHMKSFICFLIGCLMSLCGVAYIMNKSIEPRIKNLVKTIEKLISFYNLLVWWVKNYQDGYLVSEQLKKLGYRRVAIYGIKELGERTYFECKLAGIAVPFFIDKCGINEILMDEPVNVLKPSDIENCKDDIDAVIVTALTYYDEIKTDLERDITCPVLSLESIVYNA